MMGDALVGSEWSSAELYLICYIKQFVKQKLKI